MIEFFVFCMINVIISLLVEKKSKILTITHSVFFVFMLFLFVFTSESSLLQFVSTELLGKYRDIIYESLMGVITFSGLTFSAYIILEFSIVIMLILTIVMVITGVVKVLTFEKNDKGEVIQRNEISFINQSFVIFKRIFLRYCRLLR